MLSVINEKGIYVGRFNSQDIDNSWLPVTMFLDKPVKPKVLLEKIKSILKD